MFFKRSGDRSLLKDNVYNLRNQNVCVTPKITSEAMRRNFMYMAPYLHNKIPANLRILGSNYDTLKAIKLWPFNLKNAKYVLKGIHLIYS